MPTENSGRQITLKDNSVYIRVSVSDDNEVINYWTINTLDMDNENSVMLACLSRGMIEYARESQMELVKLGAMHLRAEGKIEARQETEKNEMVETASGLIIPFPKVKGNA